MSFSFRHTKHPLVNITIFVKLRPYMNHISLSTSEISTGRADVMGFSSSLLHPIPFQRNSMNTIEGNVYEMRPDEAGILKV